MAGRSFPRSAALTLVAMLALCAGCGREAPEPGKVLLFPELQARQDELERLRLRGAGNAVLVTLEKKQGLWCVAERMDWPADAVRVSQYLFVLSQTHRVEAKTENPKLYAQLGVEPIAGADATSSELELSGAGKTSRLLIGHEHVKFDSNYVRVDGAARTWLTDLPVTFERDPVAWLDRRLLDLPLARVAQVRVGASHGEPAFTLSHRDDRFRLDDAPSAAMHESHQGDALAGVLDQLRFEDVAADDGKAKVEREVQFLTVEGAVLTVQLWHTGDAAWLRVRASLDDARAAEWLRQAKGPEAAPGAQRNRVLDWNRRFEGRRFKLPAEIAKILLLSHDEILAGAPRA